MLDLRAPRPVLPSLPRAEWREHPSFPQQTLLLRSHASFRAFSDALVLRASEGTSHTVLRWLFGQLTDAMRGHESYEEHKLYPFLEARWRLDLTELRVDHETLHALADAVTISLADPAPDVEQAPPPASVAPTPLSALRDHNEELHRHLAREEELVIPGLLSLGAQEFETYSTSSIWELLGRGAARQRS